MVRLERKIAALPYTFGAHLSLGTGNLIDEKDKFGNTALHYACRNNNRDAAKILVKGGARAKVVGQWGGTPLHFYAR